MKNALAAIFKGIGLLSILAVIVGGIWLVMQPKLPDDHTTLRHEYLVNDDLRSVADSSLSLLQGIITDLGLPSLSAAVSINEDIAWSCTFGYSDIEKNLYPDQNTRYRAGSVSKSMTGLVSAKLVEEGKLNIDNSIFNYVPDFPKKQWDFTLRQLGAHTGGIRHYIAPGKSGFWAEQFSKHHYSNVEEALVLFKDDDLLYEPGTDFRYSTHGFTLLSAAIENASGKDFISAISEDLWNAYSMNNTIPDDLTQEISNRAVPYTRLAGKMLHMEGPDPSYKWAGGGILSTPNDLVRMGAAFMNAEIVNPETTRDLFTPLPLSDGSQNPQNYALGWRIDKSSELLGTVDTLQVLNHGGATPGGSSFLLLLPTEKVAAASMTNYSLRNAWPLREAMFKIAGSFRNAAKTLEVLENLETEQLELATEPE